MRPVEIGANERLIVTLYSESFASVIVEFGEA